MKRLLNRQTILQTIGLTVAMELFTLFCRFGLGLLWATESASTVGRLTMGVRIHHGYMGIVAVALGIALLGRMPKAARWITIIGIAAVASDLIHHFAILWPLTGNPEFDLLYPR